MIQAARTFALWLALGTIGLFAWFVFPGAYVYQKTDTGQVVRVNRFTGTQQFSSRYGWLSEDELNARTQESQVQDEQAFRRMVMHFSRQAAQGEVVSAAWSDGRLTVWYRSGAWCSTLTTWRDEGARQFAKGALARYNVPVGG